MDTLQRLKLLSADMELEPAEDAGCPKLASSPREPYLSGRYCRMGSVSRCSRHCSPQPASVTAITVRFERAVIRVALS